MTEADWRRRLSSGASRSMRAARIACAVAGTAIASGGLRQPVGAPLAGQHLGLHEGPHALLEEERVSLGPLDQQPLERLEGPVLPEQGVEQLLGALGRQRVEPELACSRSCCPRRAGTRAGS